MIGQQLRATFRAYISGRGTLVRPCNALGAFCGGRSPLLGLQHYIEAGQAGGEGIHFGAHDVVSSERQGVPVPKTENKAAFWGWEVKCAGSNTPAVVSVYSVAGHVNTRAHVMCSLPKPARTGRRLGSTSEGRSQCDICFLHSRPSLVTAHYLSQPLMLPGLLRCSRRALRPSFRSELQPCEK